MRISIAALASIMAVSAAFAQSRTGTLIGIVSGSHHERVAGAQVHLSRGDYQSPRFDTTTDKAGRFTFVGLPPGIYTLELSLSGWQVKRLSSLEVRAASTLDLSIILSPAAPSQLRREPRPDLLDRDVWWGRQFGEISIHELPTSRRVWSLLENQETSTVTDRLEGGGLETGRPALFGAHGASWTENQYLFNGFNVTDPYQPGRPLTDPDYDSLSVVTVVTAAKPALFSGSGASLLLTSPPLSTNFHGAVRGFYSNRTLQSDNPDARLVRFGFPGPERLNHLADGSAQLGGNLPRFSRPFFISVSTQQLSKDIGGFAAPVDAHVYHLLTKFTPFSRSTKRLDLLYAGQHILNSREGAEVGIAPSATTRGNDNFHLFQAHWREFVGDSSVFDIRLGVAHAIISSGVQPGAVGTSTIDLPQMIRSGPAPLSQAGRRTRYEASALMQTVQKGALGSHSLSLGVAFDRSNITNRWDAAGGIEQILVNGAGAEIISWNTPTEARAHVQNFTLFAQDAWRPWEWLAIPLGLRLENSSGNADGANNRINWTTIEPRVGLVIPLRPRGMVLRAAWSRYGHLLQGRYLDFGNRAALGGGVFRWQDSNGDGQAQPQEITQLLRVFGGPYSAVAGNLRRPFTDEISLGLEQRFNRSIQLRARFFRRDDHRLVDVVNTGVPFSSYIPMTVIDPGNDGILGTADDQTLTLYNRIPSALGKDFLVLANPPGYRASYQGLEIEFLKLFAHRWEASASFAAMQTSAPTNPGNSVFENDTGVIESDMGIISALGADPNTLLFATSRSFFDRGFTGKLTAYYRAPYDIRLGAIANYTDGLPFGRLLFVTGFNQGPFFVRATPRAELGAFRTQFNSTLDLRAARQFSLRRGSIRADLDIFNLLNLNNNTREADLTSPTFAQRVPLAVESPRIIRLGLEWNF